MAVDEPFFLDPRFDPVAFEEIETLDKITIMVVEEPVCVFGSFDRHAVARKHVEMRGARESDHCRLNRVERRLHQRPFSPSAFDALFGEGHIGIIGQRIPDRLEMCGLGPGVEVDCHVIASRSKTARLLHDCLRVFVAKKYVCDS